MSAAQPAPVCAHCGKAAVLQCVRCKTSFYCRRKCQKFHWSRGGHKGYCATVEERAAFDTPKNRLRLLTAVLQGDTRTALDLILRGVDVRNDNTRVFPGLTLLCSAALNGHVAIVRALLNAGADKDLAANGGATPLHAAAQNGHAAVVRALLDAGADKTVQCRGLTALDIATTPEVKRLLK